MRKASGKGVMERIKKVLTLEGGDQRFHPKKNLIWAFIKNLLWTIPNLFIFSYLNFSHSSNKYSKTNLPKPHASEPKNIKLKLGGTRLDGFVLIDPWNPEADIKRGVELGLPFSDSTVEECYIEYHLIYVKDLIFVMNEIHRVCIPGAEVEITVPTSENPLNFKDPMQCRIFNANSFDYFIEDTSEARMKGAKGFYEMFSKKIDKNMGKLEILLKVKKEAKAIDGKKIDLGCGLNKKEGCAGIDIRVLEGVDIVRDVNNRGLPFSDSTIEYVYTSHFLEHTSNLIFIINEIYRVCCDNAIVEIIVPTFLSPHATGDPSHLRFFNVHTFQHYFEGDFVDEKDKYAGICKGFQVVSQYGSTSLHVTLRVLKDDKNNRGELE
jgi:predicted SAM-dependent methyltransferase